MGVKLGRLSFRHSVRVGKSSIKLLSIGKSSVQVEVTSIERIDFVPVADIAKSEGERDTKALTT